MCRAWALTGFRVKGSGIKGLGFVARAAIRALKASYEAPQEAQHGPGESHRILAEVVHGDTQLFRPLY